MNRFQKIDEILLGFWKKGTVEDRIKIRALQRLIVNDEIKKQRITTSKIKKPKKV